MTTRLARVCAVIAVCLLAPFSCAQASAATAWPASLAAASNGTARAGTAPGAPASLTASCSSTLLGSVVLTWTSSARATSYSVQRSSTGAAGPYTVVATGVTATSWSSPALAAGTYYFQVQAVAGSFWAGGVSPAAGPRTITLALICS